MLDTVIMQPINEQRRPGIFAWTCFVFIVVLLAELIAGYYIVFVGGYVMNDAIARTANAYYVLFLNPNKLASVGFVWNPLPSLLQLPILLFSDIWRPLATHGYSGSIINAFFAAINSVLLFRYFCYGGASVFFSLLIAFLYAFNPFYFYYGLNGMSETIFFTVIIACVYNFSMWMDDRRTVRLLIVALLLAVGFLTRYEVLPFILAIILSLAIVSFLMKDHNSPFCIKAIQMKWDYFIASFIVLILPVAYTMMVWMVVSWVIMGNPIYFLNSAYSNESQAAAGLLHLRSYINSPIHAWLYMAVQSIPFIAPLVLILCVRLVAKRFFRTDMLVLTLFAGCFLGFHYMLLLSGKSFGWLRFFSYVLPVCLAWYAYEMRALKGKIKNLSLTFLCIALFGSAALIPKYFSDVNLANEEYTTLFQAKTGAYVLQHEFATIINEKYSDSIILMDSFSTSSLIVNLEKPENVITSTSDTFIESVIDPRGMGIEYILLPLPKGIGFLDALNNEYPDLYNYGVPSWADLADQNDLYRLYKVTREGNPLNEAP